MDVRQYALASELGAVVALCSIRTFLGEKTLGLLNSVYPEIKRELEKFAQQDALRAPLNDLRIFGESTLRDAGKSQPGLAWVPEHGPVRASAHKGVFNRAI